MLTSKKAFSLIEVSIVVLIISIIIAGVTQSSVLIQKMRLASARSQTQSSAVPSISGLSLWYETTLEESYQNFEEPDNEDYVTIWRDINPQSSFKNNAEIASPSTGPKYIADCQDALPCLRFDAINQYLVFNGDFLVGTNYTVFAVESRSSDKEHSYFIGGGSSDTINSGLQIGYFSDTLYKIDHSRSTARYIINEGGYTDKIMRIHTALFDTQTGRTYYINNAREGDANTGDPDETNSAYEPNSPLASYDNPGIGAHYSHSDGDRYYIGDIFEIIIYNRALKDEEINSVNEYLAKKWNITI